jgi:hypothetical protein
MCGVVGIAGKSPVNQMLFDALTMLQHRGQDAAGIVTCHEGRLFLRGISHPTYLPVQAQKYVMYPELGSRHQYHALHPIHARFSAQASHPFLNGLYILKCRQWLHLDAQNKRIQKCMGDIQVLMRTV